MIEFTCVEDIIHIPELGLSLQDIMEALPTPIKLKEIRGLFFYLYEVSDGYWIIQKNPDETFFVTSGDKLDLIFEKIKDTNNLIKYDGTYLQ